VVLENFDVVIIGVLTILSCGNKKGIWENAYFLGVFPPIDGIEYAWVVGSTKGCEYETIDLSGYWDVDPMHTLDELGWVNIGGGSQYMSINA
jgi:hypothetical protein